MRVVVAAPVMRKTPSGLPSRSVTATVTLRFSAAAAETACAMTVCTSAVERLPAVTGLLFGVGVGAGTAGVGMAPGSSGGPPPTWPSPTRTRLLGAPLYVMRTSTSPASAASWSLSRTTIELIHSCPGTGPTCSTASAYVRRAASSASAVTAEASSPGARWRFMAKSMTRVRPSEPKRTGAVGAKGSLHARRGFERDGARRARLADEHGARGLRRAAPRGRRKERAAGEQKCREQQRAFRARSVGSFHRPELKARAFPPRGRTMYHLAASSQDTFARL